jgi:hypothetical protein
MCVWFCCTVTVFGNWMMMMMIGVGRLQPSIDTLLLDDGENFVECSAMAET